MNAGRYFTYTSANTIRLQALFDRLEPGSVAAKLCWRWVMASRAIDIETAKRLRKAA